MARHRSWSADELLVAFRLYCRMPFGRLHSRNPEIVEIGKAIGRTPSAVAMKACNFASLDPLQQARGISALGNVSQADRELWGRFESEPDAVAADAESAFAKILHDENQDEIATVPDEVFDTPSGPTEQERLVRARRVQRFFRDTVLVSYEQRCALSDLAVRELLNASHIIPWKDNAQRRADPRNGLCLNALYDRAFDRGLISFDESLRVLVSPAIEHADPPPFHRDTLLRLAGKELRRPMRFDPDGVALTWHREHVFQAIA